MHKRTIVEEEKIRYLCYHASTEENSAVFLANHFCKWLPAEAGRRPPAPGHCTDIMCSKHATLALKPDVTAVVRVRVLIAKFKLCHLMTARSKLRGQKGNSASVFCPFAPVESFLVAKVSMRERQSRGDVDRVVTWPPACPRQGSNPDLPRHKS